MAFAKITDEVTIELRNINIDKLSNPKRYNLFFFNFEEIELLMQQIGANAVTVKQALITPIGGEGKWYNVMLGVRKRLSPPGHEHIFVETGNIIVFSCPRPARPETGLEYSIKDMEGEPIYHHLTRKDTDRKVLDIDNIRKYDSTIPFKNYL